MAEPKFEKDIERLEALVEALETGGLSLDDSLKRFEEGIKLVRRCEKALRAAEKRIEMLTRTADGELTATPFEGDEGNGDEPPETLENGPAAEEDNGEQEGELLF